MNGQGMPWFRLYAEFIEDYYVRTLPEAMQLRYILLLCLKCKGSVTVTDENVAWLLRITPEEAIETKQCLTRKLNAEGKQLIDENWEPVNWDKRQYKTESSQSRVRKNREFHAQNHTDSACNDDVTLCNGDVTPPDTDTDTDTDTETDTEKNSTFPSLSIESSARLDNVIFFDTFFQKPHSARERIQEGDCTTSGLFAATKPSLNNNSPPFW